MDPSHVPKAKRTFEYVPSAEGYEDVGNMDNMTPDQRDDIMDALSKMVSKSVVSSTVRSVSKTHFSDHDTYMLTAEARAVAVRGLEPLMSMLPDDVKMLLGNLSYERFVQEMEPFLIDRGKTAQFSEFVDALPFCEPHGVSYENGVRFLIMAVDSSAMCMAAIALAVPPGAPPATYSRWDLEGTKNSEGTFLGYSLFSCTCGRV